MRDKSERRHTASRERRLTQVLGRSHGGVEAIEWWKRGGGWAAGRFDGGGRVMIFDGEIANAT